MKKNKNKMTMDDSPTSREKNLKRNLSIILNELGFKDDPESRKLDPWMVKVLAREEKPQQIDQDQQDMHSVPDKNEANNGLNQDSLVVESAQGEKQPHPRNHISRKSSTGSSRSAEQSNVRDLPLELRNRIMNEMGGSKLRFLMEKELTMEDVSPDQNRFLVLTPKKDRKKNRESSEAEGEKMWIPTKLMVLNHDYQFETDQVEDINMNMLNSYTYELNGVWYSIVQKHQLKEHMLVQVWGFLVDSEVNLALIKLRDPPTVQ